MSYLMCYYVLKNIVTAASLGDGEPTVSGRSSLLIQVARVHQKRETYKKSRAGGSDGDTPILKSVECERGAWSTAKSYLPRVLRKERCLSGDLGRVMGLCMHRMCYLCIFFCSLSGCPSYQFIEELDSG